VMVCGMRMMGGGRGAVLILVFGCIFLIDCWYLLSRSCLIYSVSLLFGVRRCLRSDFCFVFPLFCFIFPVLSLLYRSCIVEVLLDLFRGDSNAKTRHRDNTFLSETTRKLTGLGWFYPYPLISLLSAFLVLVLTFLWMLGIGCVFAWCFLFYCCRSLVCPGHRLGCCIGWGQIPVSSWLDFTSFFLRVFFFVVVFFADLVLDRVGFIAIALLLLPDLLYPLCLLSLS
jgi:hypothetical protein